MVHLQSLHLQISQKSDPASLEPDYSGSFCLGSGIYGCTAHLVSPGSGIAKATLRRFFTVLLRFSRLSISRDLPQDVMAHVGYPSILCIDPAEYPRMFLFDVSFLSTCDIHPLKSFGPTHLFISPVLMCYLTLTPKSKNGWFNVHMDLSENRMQQKKIIIIFPIYRLLFFICGGGGLPHFPRTVVIHTSADFSSHFLPILPLPFPFSGPICDRKRVSDQLCQHQGSLLRVLDVGKPSRYVSMVKICNANPGFINHGSMVY